MKTTRIMLVVEAESEHGWSSQDILCVLRGRVMGSSWATEARVIDGLRFLPIDTLGVIAIGEHEGGQEASKGVLGLRVPCQEDRGSQRLPGTQKEG